MEVPAAPSTAQAAEAPKPQYKSVIKQLPIDTPLPYYTPAELAGRPEAADPVAAQAMGVECGDVLFVMTRGVLLLSPTFRDTIEGITDKNARIIPIPGVELQNARIAEQFFRILDYFYQFPAVPIPQNRRSDYSLIPQFVVDICDTLSSEERTRIEKQLSVLTPEQREAATAIRETKRTVIKDGKVVEETKYLQGEIPWHSDTPVFRLITFANYAAFDPATVAVAMWIARFLVTGNNGKAVDATYMMSYTGITSDKVLRDAKPEEITSGVIAA